MYGEKEAVPVSSTITWKQSDGACLYTLAPFPTNLHVEFLDLILQKANQVVLRCSNLLISHFLLIRKGRSLRMKWEGQVKSGRGR